MLTSSTRGHGGAAHIFGRSWLGAVVAAVHMMTASAVGAQSGHAAASAPAVATERSGLEIVIETVSRELVVLQGSDTLLVAPIGVATGQSFAYGTNTWRFSMRRGEWRVRRKVENPVWVPPDWHYAETAWNYDLKLVRLPLSGLTLRSGARLEIRNKVVGIVYPGSEFAGLPVDEHIVFEGRLFIPPLGTMNRRVEGNLGRYALDLGSGYLIHGTTNQSSIGAASTHGCIRIGDDDLQWLFENVPLGTRVLVR